MQRDDWADFHTSVKQLAECMNSYAQDLSSENVKQEQQLELSLQNSPLNNFDVCVREALPMLLLTTTVQNVVSILQLILMPNSPPSIIVDGMNIYVI